MISKKLIEKINDQSHFRLPSIDRRERDFGYHAAAVTLSVWYIIGWERSRS